MKIRYKLLIVTLMFSFGTQTQAQQVLSRADRMNVMYVGVENPITIMAFKVPIKEVSLEMANCAIKRMDDFHFTVTPTKLNYKGETLQFKYKGKVIGEEVYRVKSVPPPPAGVGGIKDVGVMSTGEFKAQIGIGCYDEASFIPKGCSITFFRFRIIRNGILIVNKEYNDSQVFNDDFKATIKQIQSGDEVLFSDMKYKNRGVNETQNKTENSFIFIKIK